MEMYDETCLVERAGLTCFLSTLLNVHQVKDAEVFTGK